MILCIFYLFQLRQEKVELEQTLEKEQEYQVNKLMRKIEKLERETLTKQSTLEQVNTALLCVIYRVMIFLCRVRMCEFGWVLLQINHVKILLQDLYVLNKDNILIMS